MPLRRFTLCVGSSRFVCSRFVHNRFVHNRAPAMQKERTNVVRRNSATPACVLAGRGDYPRPTTDVGGPRACHLQLLCSPRSAPPCFRHKDTGEAFRPPDKKTIALDAANDWDRQCSRLAAHQRLTPYDGAWPSLSREVPYSVKGRAHPRPGN